MDPEWFTTIATPGWQQRWLENFTANQAGELVEEDLVQDGWTDMDHRVIERIRDLPSASRTAEGMMAAFEDADFEQMEEIRRRCNEVVEDQTTAERLKAWYQQRCKRRCCHDEYLAAYNEPGCQRLDTDGRGVERTTERGVVFAAREYEVDCIIYASGFEAGTPFERRSGFDTIGRDGLALSDYWADGMRTMPGQHVHGLANPFIVQGPQDGNLVSNCPHNLTEGGTTIALMVRHALDVGAAEVEVSRQAGDDGLELLTKAWPSVPGSTQCTPGCYNNEGKGWDENRLSAAGYPAGPLADFRYLEQCRNDGFKGMEFR